MHALLQTLKSSAAVAQIHQVARVQLSNHQQFWVQEPWPWHGATFSSAKHAPVPFMQIMTESNMWLQDSSIPGAVFSALLLSLLIWDTVRSSSSSSCAPATALTGLWLLAAISPAITIRSISHSFLHSCTAMVMTLTSRQLQTMLGMTAVSRWCFLSTLEINDHPQPVCSLSQCNSSLRRSTQQKG